ncbi:MAG TPA: hypothetical protein VH186_25805 [Chloroflexia bacterium]|nr:hypothetical protein [Chloroflexia bacterium]
MNGTLVLGYAGLLISLATGLFDMQASPKALAREGWIIIAVLHIISAVSLLLVYGCFLYRRFLVLPSELTLPANPASSGSSTSDLSTESGKLSTKVIEPETLPVATIVTLDKLSIVLAALGLVLLIIAGWLGGTLVYDYRVGLS